MQKNIDKLCAEYSNLKHRFHEKTELVRCKNCKHCFVEGENVTYNICELNHNKVQPDEWFCADGERKEGR